ncbi:MAG: V-type ATP synthase subunit E family protein [Dethiobacteria bacterium]
MENGAERICRRIQADIREKVEEIAAEATRKSEAILADAEKEARKQQEQILERMQKKAEEQKRRILSMAQLDARKEVLAAKQELINDAFNQALDMLFNLDPAAYLEILRRMLLSSIKTGEEVIILSPRDKSRIPDDFWNELNRELAAAGYINKISPGEADPNISGGFILRAGGIEINNSFGSLLEMYRDDLEPEVAALLFEE